MIKWGAVAACFALIAVTASAFSEQTVGGDNAVTLAGGDTIRFVQSDAAAAKQLDIAFEIRTRALTVKEIANIFGDLPVTAYAIIDRENDRVLGIEGRYDNMKLTVSAPWINLSDTVIEGKEKTPL